MPPSAEARVGGAVGQVAGQGELAGGDDLAVRLDGDGAGALAVEVGRDLAFVAEGRVEALGGRRGDTVDGHVGDVGAGDRAAAVGDGADLQWFGRLGGDPDVVGEPVGERSVNVNGPLPGVICSLRWMSGPDQCPRAR